MNFATVWNDLLRLRAWPIPVLVFGVLAQGGPAVAQPVRTNYSTVELVAEHASMPADGGTVTVGLRLEPDPTWHAYWINPGDAGLAASVRWSLPDGFSASELQFPAPHVIPFVDMITYGFDEPILLLSDIAVPAGRAGDTVDLQGDARWIVCDDELCVPESASLRLTLPFGDGELDPRQAETFAEARSKLPEVVDWPAQFELDGESVRVSVKTPDSIAEMHDPYLFVEPRRVVKYVQQSATFAPGGGIVVSMEAGRKAAEATGFAAVLRFSDSAGDEQVVQIDVQEGATDTLPPVAGDASSVLSEAALNDMPLALAFLFAFVGGLILNLMPCVFPVLSIKALSLVRMGQTAGWEAQQSGLLYTAGILVAFALAGGALVALREAGQAVGWGIQMQYPLVNLGLALLMVAIALNLLGVFEFGVRAAGVGQSLTVGSERRAAFFTGLLAVVVATPCTAPYMAGALGYALVQPAPVALGVFLALGLGLAFPYLLISFIPSLGAIMPKPGAWMATFRSILAFPMLGFTVWLFWILGKQLGPSSMALGLLAAVFLGFALWAWGRVFGSAHPWPWRGVAAIGLVAMLVAGAKVEDYRMDPTAGADYVVTLGELEVERFTPDRVTGYVESGQPVFVYFTADWCINCKVNERVALASDAVGAAFRDRGIKVLEGDWTNQDPVITEWLGRYGRVGVPLYLYYAKGASLAEAAVLPQVLLPDVVIAAVDEAEGGATAAAEPDWSVVQAYIDIDEAWHALDDEIRDSDASLEEKNERRETERGPHPDISNAVAAANAILDLDGAHERTQGAAVFLMEHTMGLVPDSVQHVSRGALVMEQQFPGYEDWPKLLYMLDFYTRPGEHPEVEALFERRSESAADAVTRATARYYQAFRNLRLANEVSTPSAERERYRERALATAEGLSAGVEEEELVKRRRFEDDGTPIPFQTLAEAERDLLYNLNHLTVGRKLPNVAATRLDGVEEDFSTFRNQAVLIDFWATWCGPCKAALPKLRELNDELPADSFEILSISVDDEVDTVTEFQAEEPMPWANWHIGPRHEILRTWAVRGYPTYVLVDASGNIAARQHELNDTLISVIRSTAGERS